MSQTDIERFVADLKSDSSLLDGLKGQAAGLSSVVDFAKGKGYDVTIEEAKSYVSQKAGQDLSDDQLDAIAGGKGHHHHHHSVATNAVEAAEVATTAVQTAEAVTTVAEAADAATTVEVVAEVAIVLT